MINDDLADLFCDDISKRFPYSFTEVRNAYRYWKSFDIVISLCSYFSSLGAGLRYSFIDNEIEIPAERLEILE